MAGHVITLVDSSCLYGPGHARQVRTDCICCRISAGTIIVNIACELAWRICKTVWVNNMSTELRILLQRRQSHRRIYTICLLICLSYSLSECQVESLPLLASKRGVWEESQFPQKRLFCERFIQFCSEKKNCLIQSTHEWNGTYIFIL